MFQQPDQLRCPIFANGAGAGLHKGMRSLISDGLRADRPLDCGIVCHVTAYSEDFSLHNRSGAAYMAPSTRRAAVAELVDAQR